MYYIRFFIFIILFAGQSLAQVVTDRPRLLLDSNIISKLESRRFANTAEWTRLKQRMDAYLSMSGQEIINDYIGQYEYIMTYALGYYASGDQTYMDKAVDILMAFYNATNDASIQFDSGYNSRGYLFALALGYDWCYNSMTDEQRQQIRNRIITWTDWIIANGYAVWNSLYYEPGNNYTIGHLLGISAAGYAIYSEAQSKAQQYISNSTQTITNVLGFTNSRLRAGDANEGWSYGSGYAMNLFMTYALIKSASSAHTDYFIQSTWDEQVIKFLIYATLPDRKHILPNGDWARESTGLIWDQHRSVSDLISSYCDIEESRQLACYWGPETWSTSKFHNFYVWRPFLFFNSEDAAIDYKTIDPFQSQYWWFTDSSGTGQFIQRTNWDASACWVSFRSGGMYGDHAHNGNGHIEIWENGWLVIDENILSSSGTLIPDYAHNRVQIQPMSEDWNLPDNPYHMAEHAAIPKREFTNKYSYIYENSTNVYQKQNDNTATKTERQFFFLPGQKTIVTFDIAATTTSSYWKRNRWHFNSAPTRNGNIFSYSNGSSNVFCHAVYPINPTITLNSITLDIEYPAARAKNYFITALYTTPVGTAAYNVQGISRDAGNVQESDLYGAGISNGNQTNAVIFAGDDAAYSYNHLAYSININEVSNHYVIGLKSSSVYYVKLTTNANTLNVDVNTQNTGDAITLTSSPNGVLSFTHSSEPAPENPQNIKITQ